MDTQHDSPKTKYLFSHYSNKYLTSELNIILLYIIHNKQCLLQPMCLLNSATNMEKRPIGTGTKLIVV